MKVKEIVYMILDEAKLFSDDALYNEEHILFLLSKYRSQLLDAQKKAGAISEENYQTICLDLIPYPSQDCHSFSYSKSEQEIPALLTTAAPKIYVDELLGGSMIVYISEDRFPYVGANKFTKNIIYATKSNGRLFLRSENPQFLYLRKLRFRAVFADVEAALELSCDKESQCDIMEMDFPFDDALVPILKDKVLRDILGVLYRPKDNNNNAKDEHSEQANAARQQQQAAQEARTAE